MADTFEYRCDNCSKLLLKGNLEKGKIEIKCRCGHIQVFTTGVKLELEKLRAIFATGK